MELLVLLAADYANVEKEGKLNVMGIFSEIYGVGFPLRQPEMHLIVSLSASPAEYSATRRLTIKLLNEDATQEIMNWSRQIDIPKGTGGQRVTVNQILRLRDLIFPSSGIYQFSVLVDDDEKGALPIMVVERKAIGD